MYSRIVKFLEDAGLKHGNVWNILFVFYSLLAATLLLVFFWHTWKRRRFLSQCHKVSKKVPFFSLFGNIIDFVKTSRYGELSTNVYWLQVLMGYQQMFKNNSFFFFWLAFRPFIIVTKAKGVEELIAGSKNMEKSWVYDWLHPWLGMGLLTSYGSKWKSRRKMLTPSFHFDILKDFLPVFNEQSQVLVQILQKETEKPWIDIVNPITLCSLDIVCETTLGASIGAQFDSESEYVHAVSRTAKLIMKRLKQPQYFFNFIFNLSRDGYQFKKDVKLLHNFTKKVIAEKKEKLLNKTEDNLNKKRKALMDLLLDQHIQNQSLTEEDIREEVDTFAFEGHDTTSMGMSWALYLIGLHKDVQNNIHEELDQIFGDDFERHVTTDDLKDMEYLDRVLKESQRLYPSVPFIGRKLSGDVTIDGTKITKDIEAIILIFGLHRDETVFPDPEKFDPDRFLSENAVKRSPFAYIPFSAGPRNCIGQRFAIMEEKVVIAHVLRNFTLESLDPRDKVLTHPELILRAANDIRIKLTSRRPS